MEKPRYRARGIVYLFFLALFAVMAGLTLLWATGYTVDFASRSVYKGSLLVINSTPNGAAININGRDRGRTDSRIKLKPGSYQIKLELTGRRVWEKQIKLGPGEAQIEESVLLFNTEPTVASIANAVTAQTVSPNRQQVAYLTRGAGQVGLNVATTNEPINARQLLTLPEEFAQPSSFVFSPDNGRVLISTANQLTVVQLAGGPATTLPIGGPAVFAPGADNLLIVQAGSTLVTVDLTTGARQPLAEGVLTWTTTDQAVYFAQPGRVIRRNLQTNAETLVATERPVAELSPIRGSDSLLVRDNSRTLFRLRDNRLEKVAEGVTVYATGQNSLAYLANQELYIQRGSQPARLVTRFGQPIDGLGVVTDGEYLFYLSRGELHSIAADGRNDFPLAPAGITPLTQVDSFGVLTLSTAGQLSKVTLLQR